ncbi:hypothetical protein EV132_101525 [Rhizobium sullae]|uniref:Uncharacterized protein n=1 Tax=Rhizobium sullae TaxID=50338 RepID=A0A4R3QFH8_RHISU|nr:hypothetical protein EV132_101525 [Rhizobium sullae]
MLPGRCLPDRALQSPEGKGLRRECDQEGNGTLKAVFQPMSGPEERLRLSHGCPTGKSGTKIQPPGPGRQRDDCPQSIHPYQGDKHDRRAAKGSVVQVACVKERNDHDRPEVVDDGKGRQEDLESLANEPTELPVACQSVASTKWPFDCEIRLDAPRASRRLSARTAGPSVADRSDRPPLPCAEAPRPSPRARGSCHRPQPRAQSSEQEYLKRLEVAGDRKSPTTPADLQY